MDDYPRVVIGSPLGMLTLASNGKSLTELQLTKPQETTRVMGHQELPVFAETRRWLDRYFAGEHPGFLPLLAPQGTPFQQKVWRELLTIPYGQTASYGDIARRVGCRSAQAIGQAVHRNPIAIIIPCHRVIGADGSLTGYAAGLEVKRKLLWLEQAIKQNTKNNVSLPLENLS